MSAATAKTRFARLANEHEAVCKDCGRHAEYLIILAVEEGELRGQTYCPIHFAIVAARAVGITR